MGFTLKFSTHATPPATFKGPTYEPNLYRVLYDVIDATLRPVANLHPDFSPHFLGLPKLY
jgi:hypothetical protein